MMYSNIMYIQFLGLVTVVKYDCLYANAAPVFIQWTKNRLNIFPSLDYILYDYSSIHLCSCGS